MMSVRALVMAALIIFVWVCSTIWLRDETSLPELPNDTDASRPEQSVLSSAPSAEQEKHSKPSEPITNRSDAAPSHAITAPIPKNTSSHDAVYSKPTDQLLARYEYGRWVTQGDILIPDKALNTGLTGGDITIAQIPHIQLWEGGIIPYELDKLVDAGQVAAAIAEIESKTFIKFVKRERESDFVQFVSPGNDHEICQSYLGRQGGRQEIVLHSSCSHGQILHEIMHALGFVHEQSREDRDPFINIEWTNIQTNQKNQFQKIAAEISIPVRIDFDFKSILLYPSSAFSTNGKFTITKKDGSVFFANRAQLSDLDVIRIDMLYRQRGGFRG